MLQIQHFVFNHIQVNTYILFEETKQALVIDPAFYYPEEITLFDKFVSDNELQIVEVVFTHPHSDHLAGGAHIIEKYNIIPRINSNSALLLQTMEQQADLIGFTNFIMPQFKFDLEEGETLKFGNYFLNVMYMPGHADGSVCLYNPDEKILFTGDVLFRSSIGRTDFPTGDYELLINNIKSRIFTLPEDVTVYPGHNNPTTVKFEKRFNPFFN
ncbi:MBL fold metallo-hydrolase [Bacteroidales bacterium OttesenSCG-928-K03]|nr:MBL fold metallo-hydrolase [Odoribacter sp. OttesenSCG-928-L07]MDL2242687.1 MBL fold metallo-hydrolase [Bacteroidales bacterium OttesenSCG-928-K03]